jgi:hypothetical protein
LADLEAGTRLKRRSEMMGRETTPGIEDERVLADRNADHQSGYETNHHSETSRFEPGQIQFHDSC